MAFRIGETLRIKPDATSTMMIESAVPVRFRGLRCKLVSHKGSYLGDNRVTIEFVNTGDLEFVHAIRHVWRIMPHCLERIKSVCMFNEEV